MAEVGLTDKSAGADWSAGAVECLQRDLKLAFFDIDGTLLGLDGQYSRRTAQAIQRLRQAGVKTAVASGRPLFAADFLIDQLQLQDAGLFYTGALLHDPASDQTLACHSLPPELWQPLLAAAQARGIYAEVCMRHNFYAERPTPLGEMHYCHLRAEPRFMPLDRLPDEPVIKLLFAVDSPEEHALLYQLEAEYPAAEFAYARLAARPDWLFVSVISPRACKRQGFQQLLDYHAVTAAEVIAFGDAHSDKVFLQQAGVGVAMGNAAADVQAVADLVTAPVWDDGVALVLEHWLAQRV